MFDIEEIRCLIFLFLHYRHQMSLFPPRFQLYSSLLRWYIFVTDTTCLFWWARFLSLSRHASLQMMTLIFSPPIAPPSDIFSRYRHILFISSPLRVRAKKRRWGKAQSSKKEQRRKARVQAQSAEVQKVQRMRESLGRGKSRKRDRDCHASRLHKQKRKKKSAKKR